MARADDRLFENLYKIGRAISVRPRISQLQTGCPFRIELVHVIPAARPKNLERGFHAMFDHKRYMGEWFQLGDSEVAWICSLKEAG